MDFQVDQLIRATSREVAAIMFDPDREPEWITGAQSVERLTPGPIGVGWRVRRTGGLLARSAWVTEVTAFEPDRLLAMELVDGPVHGTLTFEVIQAAGGVLAEVKTHSRADHALPGAGWMVKHAAAEDLKRLAQLVVRQHA